MAVSLSKRLPAVIVFALTILCGIGVVSFETPINFALLLVWLVILRCTTHWIRQQYGSRRALLVSVVHGLTMAAMITAAALAPGKRIDRLKEQSILLPSPTMTVAQLSEFCKWNRKSLPISIYFPTPCPTAATTVRFSSTRITVREFIDQIERQSRLTGLILGCGNAYTILDGGAYNFGLSFH